MISHRDLTERLLFKVPNIRTNAERTHILKGLHWLGIFSDTQHVDPKSTPLDALCVLLEEKLAFEPGERDMVILQHRFKIEHADGRQETRTSTLLRYGEPQGNKGGFSAMASLVGTACAVATTLVLDGTISRKGLLAPLTDDITVPFMYRLKERYGIECIEKTLELTE